MRKWPKIRLSTVARLSIGLLSLVLSLLMLSDLLLNVVSSNAQMETQYQKRFSESLATQLIALIGNGNQQTLEYTLEQVVVHNPHILSVVLRQKDGLIVAQRGDSSRQGIASETGASSRNLVRVPINQGARQWGDIEIIFAPSGPQNMSEWLMQPFALLIGLVTIGGFALFYAYLSRSLQHLDPSAAVPEHVRKAYDALCEGILVLDSQERIVMANRSFRNLHPDAANNLMGLKMPDLEWMQPALANLDQASYPWTKVLHDSAPVADKSISIPQPDGQPKLVIVTCGPIVNNFGQVRGCLVNFNDVTELHRLNDQLTSNVQELEQSRKQIELQNEELRYQATRDPLTGCYNRRYFFDTGSQIVEQSLRNNANLGCIMADIDFFKSFNDLYGHSIGDQVIKAVARALSATLRTPDILCRYGGEEFCILLPDTTLEQTYMVADRIRALIEKNAISSIRSDQTIKNITSSFGVASLAFGATDLKELIDRADVALYASKEGGRNRVTTWKPEGDHPVEGKPRLA